MLRQRRTGRSPVSFPRLGATPQSVSYLSSGSGRFEVKWQLNIAFNDLEAVRGWFLEGELHFPLVQLSLGGISQTAYRPKFVAPGKFRWLPAGPASSLTSCGK